MPMQAMMAPQEAAHFLRRVLAEITGRYNHELQTAVEYAIEAMPVVEAAYALCANASTRSELQRALDTLGSWPGPPHQSGVSKGDAVVFVDGVWRQALPGNDPRLPRGTVLPP